MYMVTLYEDGHSYEYHIDGNFNAINLIIKNNDELQQIINIAIQSGHSIEIEKIKE